jgi:hypothetical protein
MVQQWSRTMIAKRFAAALPAVVFIAMSSQAYAGTTISDKRYWPDEVGPSSQYTVQPSDSDFGWAMPSASPQAIEPDEQRYHGGPKSND